jgi:broad-specificity NMP kinase
MIKRDIICLLGNHGCGKSSLCELINSRNETIVGIEHSNGLGINYGIDLSIVDKLTLEYLFDHENFNKIILPDQTSNQERIYWIVLDCQVDTILKRISSCPKKDIWETRKALHYFQQRFRHLGAHFGIPLIDTTHQTLEQVYNELFNLVQQYSNSYQYYRRIGTQILNYDLIQEYDLENKLSKLININNFNQITNLPEYAHEFIDINQQALYIRWYINNYSIEINHEKNLLQIGDYQLSITGPIFRLITEGESKKIYRDISENPLTKNLVFIVLKSTIYSPTEDKKSFEW